jgi:Beta-propeller repeat
LGNKEIFIAKYDTNGNFLWAKQAGSSFTDQAEAMAVDASGNSYVTGRFGSSATFGSGEANQTALTASGGAEDIFVAKYNSSGLLQWAKRAGGTSTDHGLGIGIDSAGNSYVTGIFSLTATFGPMEANQTMLTAPVGGNTDIFVAKYNSNGALQ